MLRARDPCPSLQGTAWAPHYPGYANFLPRRLVPRCVHGPCWLHLLPDSWGGPSPSAWPCRPGGRRLEQGGDGSPSAPPGPGDRASGCRLFPVLGPAHKYKKPGDFTAEVSPFLPGTAWPRTSPFQASVCAEVWAPRGTEFPFILSASLFRGPGPLLEAPTCHPSLGGSSQGLLPSPSSLGRCFCLEWPPLLSAQASPCALGAFLGLSQPPSQSLASGLRPLPRAELSSSCSLHERGGPLPAAPAPWSLSSSRRTADWQPAPSPSGEGHMSPPGSSGAAGTPAACAHCSGGRRSRTSSGPLGADVTPSPQAVEGPLTRTLTPFPRVPSRGLHPQDLITPEAHLLTPSPWGVGFPHNELWGTQTFKAQRAPAMPQALR